MTSGTTTIYSHQETPSTIVKRVYPLVAFDGCENREVRVRRTQNLQNTQDSMRERTLTALERSSHSRNK